MPDDEMDRSVREELLPRMREASFVLSICPGATPDAKFLIELGAAVFSDKAIVVVRTSGRDVPRGLRKVAADVVDVDTTDPESVAGFVETLDRIGTTYG